MFQAMKSVWILNVLLALSFLLAACVGKTPPVMSGQSTIDAQLEDGQIELIRTSPDVRPQWTVEPEGESDHEYLAFKGTSLDAANQREAERLAYQDALITIGNYLLAHVSSRIKESIEYSGASSGIYDTDIAEDTVREVVSKGLVSKAYPGKFYVEHFRRRERGFWSYYYQVQILVKYPRPQVAAVSQEATLKVLRQVKKTVDDAAQTEENVNRRTELQTQSSLLGNELERFKRRGNIWALLVGINKYRNLNITPLLYAESDVRLLANELRKVTPEQQVWLMTHDMEYDDEPTEENIIFQLKRLTEQVGPEDTLIFSFSGHGISRDGKHYLLPVNADLRYTETLETSSIPLERIHSLLSKCKARNVILFLDSCRNDPEASKGAADNLLTKGFVKAMEVKPGTGQQNFAVLYACSIDERAYEIPEKQQGIFSYYLVRGFQGEAADPGGRITVTSLATYIRKQVSAWSQKYRPSGRGQNPWLYMDGQPPIVLRQPGG